MCVLNLPLDGVGHCLQVTQTQSFLVKETQAEFMASDQQLNDLNIVKVMSVQSNTWHFTPLAQGRAVVFTVGFHPSGNIAGGLPAGRPLPGNRGGAEVP